MGLGRSSRMLGVKSVNAGGRWLFGRIEPNLPGREFLFGVGWVGGRTKLWGTSETNQLFGCERGKWRGPVYLKQSLDDYSPTTKKAALG